MIVREYLCPEHGRWESIEMRSVSTDGRVCPECGAPSEWVISAPKQKTQWFTVERGGVAEKPHPLAVDTQPLASGVSHADWTAGEKKFEREWVAKMAKDKT